MPDFSLITPSMVGAAVAIALVVLVQTAGVSSGHPDADGHRGSLVQDFHAQGAANVASALVGGIPVGASNGQTSLNRMSGARTRLATIISGVWMLLFVVALGPVLGLIPIPALAGLLILAGLQAFRLGPLELSWRTSRASTAAAVVTLVCTLTLPIPIAVLVGVAAVPCPRGHHQRHPDPHRRPRAGGVRWLDPRGGSRHVPRRDGSPSSMWRARSRSRPSRACSANCHTHPIPPSRSAMRAGNSHPADERPGSHQCDLPSGIAGLRRRAGAAGISVMLVGLAPKAAAEIDGADLEPAVTVVPSRTDSAGPSTPLTP